MAVQYKFYIFNIEIQCKTCVIDNTYELEITKSLKIKPITKF